MKKFKKMVAFCLALILVLGTTACNTKTGENNDFSEETSTGTEAKIIKIWIHKAESDDEGKIYRALVDQFNDAAFKSVDGTSTLRIKLEYKGTPETLSTAISSEMLTGGLPDIIAIDASSYAAYQAEDVIVPIDSSITAEEKASYVDSVIKQATIDDMLYGLSAMDAPGGMYYNKEIITQEILAKAGVEDYGTIDKPWSWNDVYSVLQTLRADGKPHQIKLNLGFGGTEGCMYLHSSLVFSAGGSFSENGKINEGLTKDSSLNGLRSLEKIIKNEDGENYSYSGENADAFAQGEVPLQIFGPWDITSIRKNYKDFESKYDIMPIPVYEENGNKGVIATPCGSWGFSVTKDSKKVDDAARVIAYLTGKDASLMFYEGIGTFPTNKELYNEISVFTEDGAMKSLSQLLINTATPRPMLANYPKLAVAYSNIIEYIDTMVNDPDYDLKAFVTDKANAAD